MSTTEMKDKKEELFPEIRKVADETDQLPDEDETVTKPNEKANEEADDDEVRPVQEIESMCMNCERNVSRMGLSDFSEG